MRKSPSRGEEEGVEVHCLSIGRPFLIRRLPIPPGTEAPETPYSIGSLHEKSKKSLGHVSVASIDQRDFRSSKERKKERKKGRKEGGRRKGEKGRKEGETETRFSYSRQSRVP